MDDILVEVKSRLPELDKQFAVATPELNTVAGLIRKVCKENNIAMKTSYTLRDKQERLLQWSQTLKQSGIRHGDVLYLTSEEDEYHVQNSCTWNSWWFVASISLLIGGVGITAISLLFTRNGQPQFQYGVVLDAGSSHTSMYLYRWEGGQIHNTAVAKQIHSCNVKGGGLTSYQNNVTALVAPLKGCLDEAKSHVPVESRADTPISLGATAGMRMLSEVDVAKSVQILDQVRNTLSLYPFKFTDQETQARIISGQDEGTFGWVTANYVSGKLGVTPDLPKLEVSSSEADTIGALDMGGASTQITFYTPKHEDMPADYREDLVLYGRNYSVYTHSYLCYGINEAIRQYQAILVKAQGMNETHITSPCGPLGNTTVAQYVDVFEAPCTRYVPHLQSHMPSGSNDLPSNYTFVGTGNETECKDTVAKIFNFTVPCPTKPCTFNGTYQPPVYGKFYAFSTFFYELDFLNLTRKKEKNHTLAKFDSVLSKLCTSPWSEVKEIPAGDSGSYLGWYCFEGHYMRSLLVDAYKFNDTTWSSIDFVKEINDTDVGWSLGYMLNESNGIAPIGPKTFISTAAFSALTVLFAIFLLLAVGFGCYARKHQRQHRVKGLYREVPTYGAV